LNLKILTNKQISSQHRKPLHLNAEIRGLTNSCGPIPVNWYLSLMDNFKMWNPIQITQISQHFDIWNNLNKIATFWTIQWKRFWY